MENYEAGNTGIVKKSVILSSSSFKIKGNLKHFIVTESS